jgi:hypothetical protein
MQCSFSDASRVRWLYIGMRCKDHQARGRTRNVNPFTSARKLDIVNLRLFLSNSDYIASSEMLIG